MLSRVEPLAKQLKSPSRTITAKSGYLIHNGQLQLTAYGGLPPRAFWRIREYVLSHLEEDISNHVLAEFAGLSSHYFARAFKKSAGVSPHRFVLQSRVERVKHLLAETELPLAEIALAAGFGDQSHCTRWFHKLVGVTPSRFRWLRR